MPLQPRLAPAHQSPDPLLHTKNRSVSYPPSPSPTLLQGPLPAAPRNPGPSLPQSPAPTPKTFVFCVVGSLEPTRIPHKSPPAASRRQPPAAASRQPPPAASRAATERSLGTLTTLPLPPPPTAGSACLPANRSPYPPHHKPARPPLRPQPALARSCPPTPAPTKNLKFLVGGPWRRVGGGGEEHAASVGGGQGAGGGRAGLWSESRAGSRRPKRGWWGFALVLPAENRKTDVFGWRRVWPTPAPLTAAPPPSAPPSPPFNQKPLFLFSAVSNQRESPPSPSERSALGTSAPTPYPPQTEAPSTHPWPTPAPPLICYWRSFMLRLHH